MTGVEITADSESASPTTDRPPLRAGDVMSTRLLAVDGEDGLLLAWELISQAGVHHLPVIGNGRCLGLVAERDLAVEVARDPLGHRRRVVRELTDGTVPFVTADTPVPAVAAQLLQSGRDAIVVHDGDNRLVGLVTFRDLLRVLAGEDISPRGDDGWDQSVAMFRLVPVLPPEVQSQDARPRG